MNTLETLYNQIMQKANEVLAIFNEFFGEEFVDMQGFKSLEELKGLNKNVSPQVLCATISRTGYILVYFPKVKVTNENDRFVFIEDLYVKVPITLDGIMDGRFSMNRASYSVLQFSCNYMHSHICRIPKDNFTEFQNPCTGSGPINATIASLNRDFDADIWRLFCLELSKYVTVESISGVPYHRLEELVMGGSRHIVGRTLNWQNRYDFYGGKLPLNIVEEFTIYLIKSGLFNRINYKNNSYSLAYSNAELIILISNAFIKWYNVVYSKGLIELGSFTGLLQNQVLRRVVYANNNFYTDTGVGLADEIAQYNGSKICTFKGKEVTLNIEGHDIQTDNSTLILNPDIISYIVTKVLNIINVKYGKEGTDSEQACRVL